MYFSFTFAGTDFRHDVPIGLIGFTLRKEMERHGMVQREVRKAEEERRRVALNKQAVAMNKQGSWTWWESMQERALTWQNIWSMEGHQIKFLLCSVYDVLPTPLNLHPCGLAESPSWLCGRQANLEHVPLLMSVKSGRWENPVATQPDPDTVGWCGAGKKEAETTF